MITALVGGQTGSEGKGLVAGHIGWNYGAHVRVGAANAGHTVYTHDVTDHDGVGNPVRAWEKHVVQQLPCAAYSAPGAQLMLGPGALISPEILEQECKDNMAWRKEQGHVPLSLEIDRRAHVVLEAHKETESESTLVADIGSTSATAREGIGAAQAARVMRQGFMTAEKYFLNYAPGAKEFDFGGAIITIEDIVGTLHFLQDEGANILLEGTQGTCLSNITGQYPYVTSRVTSAPGLAAECGMAKLDEVIMVCRCHPIRVAGNSGPFWPDSQEIDWQRLGIDPESERTTVTKKVRRVATFSQKQVAYNARLNGATQIALTFTDYMWANLAGQHESVYADETSKWPVLGPMIDDIEERTGVPVTMLGTGPHSIVTREPRALIG